MIQASLHHKDQLSDDIFTFWFETNKPLRYTAGQFTELYMPHKNPDSRGENRWFTLSSSPTEDLVAITTRISQKGSSFKAALSGLEPGQTVSLAEPMGDFVLPKVTSVPLIFVAGGIGITPMRSMVKSLVDTQEERNIILVHSVSTRADLVFQDLFESANIDYRPRINQAHLSADDILQIPGAQDEALIYLSGPEQMVEKLYKDLQLKGLDQGRLAADYFHGYQ